MFRIIAVMVLSITLTACLANAEVKTSVDHRLSLINALNTQPDGYSGLIAETGESFVIQSTSASSTKLCRVVSIQTNDRYVVESFCKAKGGNWR